MKGSVSVEYALLLIGLVGVYLVILNFYTDRVPFLAEDFKRLVSAKAEALRAKSTGMFALYFDEANVTLVLVLPKETNVYVGNDVIVARVRPWEAYTACGDTCELVIGGSPFTEDKNVAGVALLRVVKDSAGVRIE